MPKFYVTPVSVDNATSLNNISASSYARLDIANTFLASINTTGLLFATGASVSGTMTAAYFNGNGSLITSISASAISGSVTSALNSASLGGQPANYYYPASSISNASVSYATNSGNSLTTSQTNFTTLTLSGSGVATQSYVTSQGYITSAGSVSYSSSTGFISASNISGSVTSAINSTNITITNDAATATPLYMTFTSASTGNAGIKTTAASLTYTPSTGILSAPNFSGNGASITGLAKLYNGSTLVAEVNSGNEFILHRVNSASEGGQITFNRSSDDAFGWFIDLYGATASPNMRWVDSTSTVRMTLEPNGNLTTTGNVIYNQATNSQSGSAYTLALSDSGKFVEMTSSTGNTITVPAASAVSWVVGTRIDIVQYGAGTTTISPSSGVTINYYSPTSAATRTIKARYGAATLVYRASNEWILIGNLT